MTPTIWLRDSEYRQVLSYVEVQDSKPYGLHRVGSLVVEQQDCTNCGGSGAVSKCRGDCVHYHHGKCTHDDCRLSRQCEVCGGSGKTLDPLAVQRAKTVHKLCGSHMSDKDIERALRAAAGDDPSIGKYPGRP